jgi:hypothetical protein
MYQFALFKNTLRPIDQQERLIYLGKDLNTAEMATRIRATIQQLGDNFFGAIGEVTLLQVDQVSPIDKSIVFGLGGVNPDSNPITIRMHPSDFCVSDNDKVDD